MPIRNRPAAILVTGIATATIALSAALPAQTTLKPQSMPRVAEVNPRFLSYNVEAVEITGGRFWKPYKQKPGTSASTTPPPSVQNEPAGMNANMFQYRPPINLVNPKLRKLAAALGPSFLRISGTWRNSTYFQDDDKPALQTPPPGFKGVMTRAQWKAVVDFSRAVKADLVTSVATSDGARNAAGVWTPGRARAFFAYTRSLGASIAATEFMNEPTFAAIGGAPPKYNAADFARDVKLFRAFLNDASPHTLFLGPGSVGEGAPIMEGGPVSVSIRSEDMLRASGPIFDIFSYHYYGGVSRRCSPPADTSTDSTAQKALSAAWLDKNLTVEAFYAHLRDEFLPGKPLWLTETGEAACGGDPWAASFLDAFRFMDQLGTLARHNVQTVMVNTLASSDYGLLDEDTYTPRPNYWAALLWKRTMGTRVLDPGVPNSPDLRVYAHCMAGTPGGVSLVALNLGSADQTLQIPDSGQRYTLSSPDLMSQTVLLNNTELRAKDDGTLPQLQAAPTSPGPQRLSPHTITFLALPRAANSACR